MAMVYRKRYCAKNGRWPDVVVESRAPEQFPQRFSRVAPAKLRFLLDGVAQLKPDDRVLELFGGTNLSTAMIAKRLEHPSHLFSIDLRYSFRSHAWWRYVHEENYTLMRRHLGVTSEEKPVFLSWDACDMPFQVHQFDVVIAIDVPSKWVLGRGEAKKSPQMTDAERRTEFRRFANEAHRVLKKGGCFVTIAPSSWTIGMPYKEIGLFPGSPDAQFRPSVGAELDDPVRYIHAVK